MRTIPFLSLFGLIGLLSACTAKLITPPPGPIALSGVVQLARVRNATVQAFALSESGAIQSTALAETLTNENGEFQLSLPAGTGPVVIRSSGGKYENEADGVETDASELSSIVDASKTSQVPVTALTTLAKERTLELLESSGSLENAQQAAKTQIGQLFGLGAEALDAIPAPPKEITLGTKVDAVQGALALAALSHFMKSYFPSKTISEVMSALIQDIKTDGSLNGDNEAGNLQSSLAQSLAFRWNTQRASAMTAAKLNPNLAFKDFNLVEVSSLSFDSQGLVHKTVVEGVYYLGGVKTTLPESGTGVWNDMFYSMGEIGSGFFEGNCYVDGADTMSLVGGSGFCAGTYYLANEATDLNAEGTGVRASNGLYYYQGNPLTGARADDGKFYQSGLVFTGTTLSGVTYVSGARYESETEAYGTYDGLCYSGGLLLTGYDWWAACNGTGGYYILGEFTTLDYDGNGSWNNVLYSQGQPAGGLFEGVCFKNGLATNDLVNGNGLCSGDGFLYINGTASSPFLDYENFNSVGFSRFAPGHGKYVLSQPDGKLLVAGQAWMQDSEKALILRYLSNGQLDSSFGIQGVAIIADGYPSSALLLDSGKILVLCYWYIARLNSDGSLDTSFGNQGITQLSNSYLKGITVQSSGRILVSGSVNGYSQPGILGLTADGNIDQSFGLNGTVNLSSLAGISGDLGGITTLPNGQIIAGGHGNSKFLVVKLEQNGALDTSFGNGGIGLSESSGRAYDLAVQSDGGIILLGPSIARFNASGYLDNNFGSGGVVSVPRLDDIYAGILIQQDGKIILGGRSVQQSHSIVVRLNGDGTVDESFAKNGFFEFHFGGDYYSLIYRLAFDQNGQVVGTGSVYTWDSSGSNIFTFRLKAQ